MMMLKKMAQSGKKQGPFPWKKLPIRIRPLIIALCIVSIVGATGLWILHSSSKDPVSGIMQIIFTSLPVILGFLALPFLYTSSDSKPAEQAPAPAPIPDTMPFLFNERLTDPREFFCRTTERATLLHRVRKGNSTSIVGPRRIGKTWLMTYLKLVAPTQLGTSFQVGYLDASLPACKTVAGFTEKALQALSIPIVTTNPSTLGLMQLAEIIEGLSTKGQKSVLCIDEFERLVEEPEFNYDFFSGLRAITQIQGGNGLTLVTASKNPLIDVVTDQVKTSPFFNIFEQLSLKPFNEQEAKDFATAKGEQANFTEDEHRYLLGYAEEEHHWPALRLQLVGKLLVEDKQAATSDPSRYRPGAPSYWREFQRRVDETYQAAVKAGSK